ncbi:MAG: SPOR domain-containing protein [Pseudomonadota bacterium]|nr:SPOR domain-containing protein [Pseudomonadota bacterium]
MATRRRRSIRREPSSACPPAWTWLLAGMIIGFFLAFLFYLQEIGDQIEEVTEQPQTESTVAFEETQSTQTTTTEAPRFEFYDMLPQAEVPAASTQASPASAAAAQEQSPPEAPTAPKPVETPTKPPPKEDLAVTTPGRYVLQVGSFRASEEAEGLKNHLMNLGISARVKAATTNGTDQWYRVQVGPFEHLEALNQTRRRLADNNIAAIVLTY